MRSRASSPKGRLYDGRSRSICFRGLRKRLLRPIGPSQLNPKRPHQYFFDGEWKKMQVHEETIRVKGQPDQTLVVRRSHLGPVVTEFSMGARGEHFRLRDGSRKATTPSRAIADRSASGLAQRDQSKRGI